MLDITLFDSGTKYISIGRLNASLIQFITSKNSAIGNKLSPDEDILFWKDRVKHTELHKTDFISDNVYYSCLKNIPEIIQNPDYISIHPKDNSISFIKDFSQHTAVAIRISLNGKLSYRTMYPLMDAQLSHYIEKGHAWKYEKPC